MNLIFNENSAPLRIKNNKTGIPSPNLTTDDTAHIDGK
ncbi:hypothetical protein ETAE_1509 [Edwardsiella piscicida]|uniref:Uncharacterized protein n=1 Tax=Edwardsiella piscicida TaxID=1263550 RepID=A0AAU8P817_EDWPI|nr:hypothetical protein ETAE_1509 [Edwardsiella tarda EIB202]